MALTTYNPWQGAVRYGWFDAVLARYALQACGGVDALALTHLDLVPKMGEPRLCERYEEPIRLCGGAAHELGLARPVLSPASPEPARYLEQVEALLERKIDFTARGPRAVDVTGNSAAPGPGGR